MALTELGFSGTPRANRDETFAGKGLFVPIAPAPGLTVLGLWGSAVTSVPNNAFGSDVSGVFPVYLYLTSIEVIGR